VSNPAGDGRCYWTQNHELDAAIEAFVRVQNRTWDVVTARIEADPKHEGDTYAADRD
jgi:hypothetical protein